MADNARLLQPMPGGAVSQLIPNVYSVAHEFNAPTLYHESYHLHSRSDGAPPNPRDTHITDVYAEVGAWFSDEYCRGICKADLTGQAQALRVFLLFDIVDWHALGAGTDDPVSGLYGQNALCDPTVFPHDPPVPYSGDLELVSYTPVSMVDDVNDFHRPESLITTFRAAGIQPPHQYRIDITDAFNAASAGLLGIRIQDTHRYPDETWRQIDNTFGCDPNAAPDIPGECWWIVSYERTIWDTTFRRDGRGAITFNNFRLEITR